MLKVLPLFVRTSTYSRGMSQVAWGVAGLGGYVYAVAVRSSAPVLAAVACGDCSIRVLDISAAQVRNQELQQL